LVSGHFEEHEEEYMESFYEFYEKRGDEVVRTGELAVALKVSPASATEMIQRLASKGHLNYVPYKGARLTASGLAFGRTMKRRHRLLEVLLVEVLQFQGDVHEAACRMEHAVDDELEWTLDELLGRPEVDPSGRPIPPPENRHSPFPKQPLVQASTLGSGQGGEILVIAATRENKDLLNGVGISIGTEILNTGSGWRVGGADIDIDDSILHKVLVKARESL
jgi:DtxR family Mn-dependent transcriptional regulator